MKNTASYKGHVQQYGSLNITHFEKNCCTAGDCYNLGTNPLSLKIRDLNLLLNPTHN